MSGYYRLSKIKCCINSVKNLKNIHKLSKNLGKEIDKLCAEGKQRYDSTDFIGRIKEVNKVLSKEFDTVTSNINNRSSGAFSKLNENVANCKTKVEGSCKPLYSMNETLKEKTSQYHRKYLKSKHVKKEAQKLLQNLVNRQIYRNTVAWAASGISLAENQTAVESAAAASSTKVVHAAPIEPIPEPPPIPDPALIPEQTEEVLDQLNALGEHTFASLGLGGWSPVGIVQNCLEYVHVTMGIEWWATIVIGTIVLRSLLFPLVVISQRNAARMNNYMPQMQALQLKMTEARQTGNAVDAARYGQEMMMFMNEKGLNPLKNMIVPMAQAPIFISLFMGLRQMANVPVESLTHGGLFWFTDLTLPDQYFILPIITSVTLWLTIELGTDAARLSQQNMVMIKYFLRAMPVLIFPFTMNFPGIILCYWVSTNFISMGQVALLRIPKVREYFKIEKLVTYKPEDLPVKPKGFVDGVKDTWTNVKITKEIEDRRRLDEIQFQRAGKGPIQKTFNYDPTKQVSPGVQTPISAKKRD